MRSTKRLYVVKTYVEATSADAALRRARKLMPDEVELVREGAESTVSAIGFEIEPSDDFWDDEG